MTDQVRKPLPGGRTQVIRHEVDEKSRLKPVARVEGQMPHDRYLARGYITQEQFDTAQLMLRLYDKGQWVELKAGSFEYIEAGDRAGLSDAAVDARKKLAWHLNRLEPAGASVVRHVCCEGWETSAWAHYYGVDRKYAMGRRKEALTTLAG